MRRQLIAFCFLLIPTFAFLQEESPVEEDQPGPVSFALRGKVWLLPGWEDLTMPSYSYGAELILGNRHCIGVDGGMFSRIKGWDDEMDKQMTTDFRRRDYVMADYKFVFYEGFDWLLYANSFVKFIGRYREWTEVEDYDFGNKDLSIYNSRIDGNYRDYGLGVGTKIYFGFSSFGFDASLNIVFRDGRFTKTSYTDKNTPPAYTTHSDDAVLPYIRLNFFYHFFSHR